MSEIHIGPHTRDEAPKSPGSHDVTETFDREINLKAIAWMVGGLVVATVVIHLLMLWLIQGFERSDKKQDVRPTPIEAAMPQGDPPGPRLQIDDNKELDDMREAEGKALTEPEWVDPAQGRVRVPIEDAMEVIVRRGLGPEIVGGQPGASVPGAPASPGLTPGATQSRPPGSENLGSGEPGGRHSVAQGVNPGRGLPPQERPL